MVIRLGLKDSKRYQQQYGVKAREDEIETTKCGKMCLRRVTEVRRENGTSQTESRGKTDNSNKPCYRCGRIGPFARDCRAKVRVGNGQQAKLHHLLQQDQTPSNSSHSRLATIFAPAMHTAPSLQISCRFGNSNGSRDGPPVFILRHE